MVSLLFTAKSVICDFYLKSDRLNNSNIIVHGETATKTVKIKQKTTKRDGLKDQAHY